MYTFPLKPHLSNEFKKLTTLSNKKLRREKIKIRACKLIVLSQPMEA